VRAPTETFKRARTLRRAMTLPELLLWEKLRGRRLERLRFRRQHPMGPYILDFYCPSAALAVEVDGLVHEGAEKATRDALRDRWLAERNVRVLRIPASDILKDERFEGVLASIAQAAAPSTAKCGPPPP
jgi:very-short-patch-repair endonuclease